ncbi:hypothetical protein BKA56DRAFT_42147 [Ilyonectria sp. MPI-CAGE-AT-0026]|nr:hypothetical protein BKA56DRAFT_42147 [Ilyonectria sp. MPI-CAGE-AT-0026]
MTYTDNLAMRMPKPDSRNSDIAGTYTEAGTGLPISHQTPGLATRTRRPRPRRTCLRCRMRKVRCDAIPSGTPCGPCRLKSRECIFESTVPQQRLPTPTALSITDPKRPDILLEPRTSDVAPEAIVSSLPRNIAATRVEPQEEPTNTFAIPTTQNDELHEAMVNLLGDRNAIMAGLADFLSDGRRDTYQAAEKGHATVTAIQGSKSPRTSSLLDPKNHPLPRPLFMFPRYRRIQHDMHRPRSEDVALWGQRGCLYIPPRY